MFNLNTFNISPKPYNTASKWLNHKDIGVMYIIFGIFSAILNTIIFLLIRMELINNFLFSSDTFKEESGTETISITNQESVTGFSHVPETELSLSNTKAKRGRPKKDSELGNTGIGLDPKPKPKRGRPKKNLELDNTKVDLNPKPKPKRGRPRKEKKH